MVGNLKVGDQIRQTHIRFRNISDYEAYINSIDEGYYDEDAVFNGYFIKSILNNLIKLLDLNMEMDVILNMKLLKIKETNCFIPTKRYCFVKCINFLTGLNYKEQ